MAGTDGDAEGVQRTGKSAQAGWAGKAAWRRWSLSWTSEGRQSPGNRGTSAQMGMEQEAQEMSSGGEGRE